MTTPFKIFVYSESDARKQPPDTLAEIRTTPIKQSSSQSEGDGKTSPPLTPVPPVKLEQLESTPTKRKREPGEASGWDATVKKSPSVLGGHASLPGSAKSSSEGKVNVQKLSHVKRQLNFSQGKIKLEEDAGCSNYNNDISHQESARAVIKKEEEPVITNEHDLIALGIPEHISRPDFVRLERNELHKMVAFGVETTSLDWGCDIIQLECSDLLRGRENFSIYIKSKKKVQYYAAEVNGLTNDHCILKQNGLPVQTVSLEEGVLQFIQHLQENTILISHNTKCFQSYHLLRNVLLEKEYLLERLQEKVVGFSDSYRIFVDLYPKEVKLPSYKLWELIGLFSKGFKNRDFRKPINGKDNVMKIGNLAELLRFHHFLDDEKKIAMLYKHSLTIDSALAQVHHCNMKKSNEVTFADMVRNGRLSKNMAQKMAHSGLTMQHLQRVFEVRGTDGILELLNPRITKNLRVINEIVLYLKET